MVGTRNSGFFRNYIELQVVVYGLRTYVLQRRNAAVLRPAEIRSVFPVACVDFLLDHT